MKSIFKARTSKFGSFIALIALSIMGILYIYAVPQFLSSSIGRIFMFVWPMFAFLAFTAHAKRIKPKKKSNFEKLSSIYSQKQVLYSRQKQRG